MKASAIFTLALSGLSGLATATNIYGYFSYNCPANAAFAKCTNVGPGLCCITNRQGKGALSGAFFGKLEHTIAGGYQATRDGRYCGSLYRSGGRGSTTVCLNGDSNGHFAGLAIISGTKLDERATMERECKPVQPDVLGWGDGREFNLTSMSYDEGTELWILASKGAAFESIPTKFFQHQIA